MASERMYAFKLKFAKHMVRVRGDASDYKRLGQVREEALRDGCAFLLKGISSIDCQKDTKLVPFPSSRRE